MFLLPQNAVLHKKGQGTTSLAGCGAAPHGFINPLSYCLLGFWHVPAPAKRSFAQEGQTSLAGCGAAPYGFINLLSYCLLGFWHIPAPAKRSFAQEGQGTTSLAGCGAGPTVLGFRPLRGVGRRPTVLPSFKRAVQFRLAIRLEREFLPQCRCVLRIDFGNG